MTASPRGSSSLVAGLGCALTGLLTGHGNPALGALAGFGGHAAALMVLLPLFMETLEFEPIASNRERALQSVITIGTTVLVFLPSDAPLVVFAVMPMFAWHAFRGSLREATLLLTIVGIIGTAVTMAGIGSIHALGPRYGVPPEIVNGVLQLFLLDCGLILLPLSVMVTQQRMATARADAERETLQRLVTSATNTAIITTGREGLIELFNPGAEEMLGYAAGEVIGKLPDRFHPESELARQAADLRALPNFTDICRASVQSGDTQRLWRVRRKDGEERSMRMTLTALTDELGEHRGYLATAEDVTERETAHRALLSTLEHQKTAVDRLRELERVKGDFVSTVSHELRTPITSIIGYTEVLEDGLVGALDVSQAEVVSRIDRNGRRLLALVEDLLTLSQIEASALKIEPERTDLRRVVADARETVAPLLADRALAVRLEIPREPVVHVSDPVQLGRMVVHLLTNAVKFTPDGGAVTLLLDPGEESSRLVVSDSGVGIPESEQARLFTRFFRSTTASERAIQGTGLGLTIVQSIVALHGGKIEVSSAPGAGTTVTVTLPRTTTVPAAEPLVPERVPSWGTGG